MSLTYPIAEAKPWPNIDDRASKREIWDHSSNLAVIAKRYAMSKRLGVQQQTGGFDNKRPTRVLVEGPESLLVALKKDLEKRGLVLVRDVL